MGYSFIRPNPKPKIDSDSRILIIFLLVTVLLILAFTAFLWFRGDRMHKEILQMQRQERSMRAKIDRENAQITRIRRLVQKYETIQTNNTLLKESIRNLFDLVPDQITLTRAVLDRNGLALYGVTPSKDVYNYLLAAPLKSVFKKSVTTFYPLKNGWYRFVSINEGNIEAGTEVTP